MKILTGSFEAEEREKEIVTLPNAMTAARAVGGAMFGAAMCRYNIPAGVALTSAVGLAATDAEGTVINASKKFPQIQEKLRIWPSKVGRMTDVVADKVYVVGLMAGGMASGIIPNSSGAAILAAEVITAGITFRVANKLKKIDQEPSVSSVGKIGMIARVGAISAYFTSAVITNETVANVVDNTGHATTIGAVACGVLSSIDLWKQQPESDSTHQSQEWSSALEIIKTQSLSANPAIS